MADLEKYKVCPACGEHNPPNLLECRKCETDLTGIKVVDSVMEQQEAEQIQQPINTGGTGAMERVCECGAHNPPQARKCEACGEDISDIIPTPVAGCEGQNTEVFSYTLSSATDDFTVIMDKPLAVIGREAEIGEYLSAKPYVSRQHAELSIVAGKVFIKNLSNTNKTFINNKQIEGNDPVELNMGDEIGLGGMEINGARQDKAAYFIIGTAS